MLEIFTWKDASSLEAAHGAPEIGRLWAAIGELVEDRPSGPKMDFPHVERLAPPCGGAGGERAQGS